MASIEQIAGLLFAYLLLYVVVSYFLYYRRWSSEDETDAAAAPTPRVRAPASAEAETDASADPSTIVCHACRTENGAEYTYCRNCIAELDGFGGRSSSV